MSSAKMILSGIFLAVLLLAARSIPALAASDSRREIASPKKQSDQNRCESYHILSPPTLPAAKVGRTYRYYIKTSGRQSAIRFSILDGRLPSGLHLNANGLITGTPEKQGTYRFSIRAASSCPTHDYNVEKRLTLHVSGPGIELSIKTQPPVFDVEGQKNTRLTVRYLFFSKSAVNLKLHSPTGLFLAKKTVIGEVKRPLNANITRKTGGTSEILTISDSIIEKARQHRTAEISYVRIFNVAGTSVAQQADVIIRIRQTQKLQVQELRLHFENNKTRAAIGKDQPPPKIYAKIKSTGSGLLKGYWEVNGRRATRVFHYKITGGGITLVYPQNTYPLSNLLPGSNRIRFVISEPRSKLILPQVMLVVSVPPAIPPQSPEALEDIPASNYLSGQIVVITESSESGRDTIEYLRGKYELRILETYTLHSLDQNVTIFHTENDILELINNIAEEEGVLLVQPNHIFRTLIEPLSDMQHIYSTLNLSEVHRQYTGEGVTLAIIDTGVDIRHTDLKKRIAGHANLLSQSPYRGEIHGTALAGVMVASINDYGIAGIAPGADLLALRACKQISEESPQGQCYTSSIAKALDMAIEEEADIVNMSFGSFIPDPLMIRILNEGDKRGILFVAPVGNRRNATKLSFPASHSKVLAVGGIDAAGKGYPNEALASAASVCAPALNVLTTVPGDRYNFLSGTSISAAIVSGVLAIAKERHRHIRIHQLPTYKGDICRWQEDLLIR